MNYPSSSKKVIDVYTKEAKIYDKARFTSKAGRYRLQVEEMKLKRYLKPPKVLELGCGTAIYGIFLAELGFDYTGIDITPAMLRFAEEKAKSQNLNIKLLKMDAHELNFKDCTFDSVFCDRVFKFFQDPIKVLRESFRVLKPKGRLVVNAELKFWATTSEVNLKWNVLGTKIMVVGEKVRE
jgi:ubiquinone/menaquinone biosynthesis C-methylase UbiE